MEVSNSTEPVVPAQPSVPPTPPPANVQTPPSPPPAEEISSTDEGRGTVLDILA